MYIAKNNFFYVYVSSEPAFIPQILLMDQSSEVRLIYSALLHKNSYFSALSNVFMVFMLLTIGICLSRNMTSFSSPKFLVFKGFILLFSAVVHFSWEEVSTLSWIGFSLPRWQCRDKSLALLSDCTEKC